VSAPSGISIRRATPNDAAGVMGYAKIFTELCADNLDSLAYHLALGFTIVGAARGHARVAGRDIDVIFIECFLKG